MLIVIVVAFIIHVFGVYWWYRNDDLVRPLVMLPPKEIPPFWHAIFFIAVNGIVFSLMQHEYFSIGGLFASNDFCRIVILRVLLYVSFSFVALKFFLRSPLRFIPVDRNLFEKFLLFSYYALKHPFDHIYQ